MKTIILILALLPAFSFAQSIDSLDSKFGYKNIRFDMPGDSLIKALKGRSPYLLGAIKSENYQMYFIPGREYRQFSDFKCSAYIFNAFEENRIGAIMLSLYDASEYNYTKIVLFFKILYGEPTKEDNIYNTVTWEGQMVRLTVSYDSYPKSLTIKLANRVVEDILDQKTKQKMDNDKKDF